MSVKPIPDGYHSVTPFLIVDDIRACLEFIKQVFEGQVIECHELDNGAIVHAEAKIGDSPIMLGPVREGCPAVPTHLYVYVPDTDAAYKRAIDAGAKSVMEPGDQFYGDRNAGVMDSTGNTWWIATHYEDVPPEEMARRAKEARSGN